MATAEQVQALYRAHFPAFIRFAFRELHPGQDLIDGPHLDVLADHLVQVANGDITRLIINMPPRSLKSFSASVALPTWLLGRDPTKQIMSVAGTRELAADFETTTRSLMTTPRCQALFPHLKPGGRRGDILLPQGGRRITGTVGNSLIGRGADVIVIDDPIAPAHVHDPARRNAVKKWFDSEVIQRLNDKKTGAVIVVMQRLHIDDLSGYLLGGDQLQNHPKWVHLNMPAVAVEDERWDLSDGRAFVRKKRQVMASDIEGLRALYDRMMDIGAYNFGAQYQQKPFEHMNEKEVRGGCFGGPDDKWGFPDMWFGTVPETAIMAHEVFGLGDHNPGAPAREMTEEEFERYTRWTNDYLRRLQDDPNAEFGPPASEEWPPRDQPVVPDTDDKTEPKDA